MSKSKKTTKNGTKPSTKPGKPAKATTGDPDLVPLNEAMKKTATKAKGGKAKASPQPAKPVKDKKLSCLDAAARVLKDAGAAMNCGSMIDAMSAKKLWTSEAPTPGATLYSAILREVQNKGTQSRFKKTDRGQFALNGTKG